ncbi:hypothetical protein AB0I81_57560 [Nonomuraea sp. NPDC050404]|uniref:protein kinase domain-containing protein n=1 Tax=Nonomuraea sp. NPDC050404 TaxID=3155783 RepID=UPI0033E59AE4
MSGILKSGEVLRTAQGEDVTVLDYLGAGGQGEVYRVQHGGRVRALKWYYQQSATPMQRSIVEDLVNRAFDDDRFLWPTHMVLGSKESFGYLMDLRPPHFHGLSDLFRRQVNVTSRELVIACVYLVEAYRALHSQGIAYRDISYGNVFFDPATGNVLVCDNDNAVVEGGLSGIEGTMEFMAPELVRGDDGASPGTQTDLHSLAVLLFMMLMNHHPLEGALEFRIRCLDEKAKRQLYGKDPVFLFDPADDRNRPVPGEQDTVRATWEAATEPLRTLFIQTFTKGLTRPEARVRETQWRDALAAAHDLIVHCGGCERQNVVDLAAPGRTCWSCAKRLRLPPVLSITTSGPRVTRTVALTRDARVCAHHLVGEPVRHDYEDKVAEVVEHPRVPGRYGLRNLMPGTWKIRRPDGTSDEVPNGRSLDLKPGIRLQIGSVEAVIQPPTW